MKRPKILICLTFLFIAISPQQIRGQAYTKRIDSAFFKLINNEDLQSASVGFCLMDVNSGENIYSYQAQKSLIPASSQKIIVAATALEVFGKDHRFTTAIGYDGVIADSILYGNLVVVGRGDPSLGSPRFKDSTSFLEKWVAAIQKAGIKEVKGGIILDEQYLGKSNLAGSTGIEDSGNYYAAGSGSIHYQDNFFKLVFSSEAKNGGSTNIVDKTPYPPFVSIVNEVSASDVDKDLAYLYSIPGSGVMIAKGSIPMGKQEFVIKGAVHEPGALLMKDLTDCLNKSDILLGNAAKEFSSVKIINTWQSPTLSKILQVMLRESDNSYADCLLKHLGKKFSGQATLDEGSKAMKTFWEDKSVNVAGWFQVDGSGLSRENAITTRTIAQILAEDSETYKVLKNSLKPLGNCKNTLVKSGYINRVRAYAGFIQIKSADFCFSFICNNFTNSSTDVRNKIELFFQELESILESE